MSNFSETQLDKLCDELLYYKERTEKQAHKIIIIQRELSALKRIMQHETDDEQIVKGIQLAESIVNREFDDRYVLVNRQTMPKQFNR